MEFIQNCFLDHSAGIPFRILLESSEVKAETHSRIASVHIPFNILPRIPPGIALGVLFEYSAKKSTPA